MIQSEIISKFFHRIVSTIVSLLPLVSNESLNLAESSQSSVSDYLERCRARVSPEAKRIWLSEYEPQVAYFEAHHDATALLHFLRDLSLEFNGKYAEHLTSEEIQDTHAFDGFVKAFDIACESLSGIKALPKRKDLIKRFKKLKSISESFSKTVSEAFPMVAGSQYNYELARFYVAMFQMLWNWSQVKPFRILNQSLRNDLGPIQRKTKKEIEQGLQEIEGFGFVIDQNDKTKIIFIVSSGSAEGKAIRRVRNPVSEDEWEVSYRPGDKVNISEIRNRLKKRVNG